VSETGANSIKLIGVKCVGNCKFADTPNVSKQSF